MTVTFSWMKAKSFCLAGLFLLFSLSGLYGFMGFRLEEGDRHAPVRKLEDSEESSLDKLEMSEKLARFRDSFVEIFKELTRQAGALLFPQGQTLTTMGTVPVSHVIARSGATKQSLGSLFTLGTPVSIGEALSTSLTSSFNSESLQKPILYSDWKRAQGLKETNPFAQDPLLTSPLPLLVNPEMLSLNNEILPLRFAQGQDDNRSIQDPSTSPPPPSPPSPLPHSEFHIPQFSFIPLIWDALTSHDLGFGREGEEENEKMKSRKLQRFIYSGDSARQSQEAPSQLQAILFLPQVPSPLSTEALEETLAGGFLQPPPEEEAFSFSPHPLSFPTDAKNDIR